MFAKNLHIVCFNIPYPANYGGVIDVFYKIKSLHKLGIGIQLHCFHYGREQTEELDKICDKVYYYERKTKPGFAFMLKPYIVVSRQSKELLKNLLQDNYPILFEGLHSTYLLKHKKLRNRTKIVRTHNVEHEYYKQLYYVEKRFANKMYFLFESIRLKLYEHELKNANRILAISLKDTLHFMKWGSSILVPAFHPNEKITTDLSRGKGILYHGNLAVGENITAVLYLVHEVFSKVDFPIIIAGKDPAPVIFEHTEKYDNISIVSNPSDKQMDQLIREAQINVLVTFQPTGIKLKLINTLFKGKYCIVNKEMVEKTGLENLCFICNKPDEIIRTINRVYNIPFDENKEIFKKRTETLNALFSNTRNAEKIIELL